ncbi:MAG: hypothetical protein Q4B50_02605, partial [Bacillota bacterium]|nr:hypothetical protein [Bacillota bacterium]
MSLLHNLGNDKQWAIYLNKKRKDHHTHPRELRFLEAFVAEKRYLPIARQMLREDYLLPLPRKALISKKNTDKKRIVYFFPPDEHLMLKLLNHLMIRKYDERLSDACHSFHVGRSVKTVMHRIGHLENLEEKYSLKLDISSYGNSIPVEALLQATG